MQIWLAIGADIELRTVLRVAEGSITCGTDERGRQRTQKSGKYKRPEHDAIVYKVLQKMTNIWVVIQATDSNPKKHNLYRDEKSCFVKNVYFQSHRDSILRKVTLKFRNSVDISLIDRKQRRQTKLMTQ